MSEKQNLRELAILTVNSMFGEDRLDNETGARLNPEAPIWWLKDNVGSAYNMSTIYTNTYSRDIYQSENRRGTYLEGNNQIPANDRNFTYKTDSIVLVGIDEQTTYNSVIGHRVSAEDTYYIDNWEQGKRRKGALALPIKTVKEFTGTDGKTIKLYSQYSESTLSYFSSPIDLTGCDLGWTFKAKRIVDMRESAYARNKKYQAYSERAEIYIDYISSFSCFSEQYLSKQIFKEKAGNNKIKVLKLSSLYRGGNGQVEYTSTELYPQKIAKGSCIFPYIRKITILNQETRIWEDAMLFCLGIFEPLDKIMKYKRAKDFMPKLLKDMEKFNGLKLFNPAKYQQEVQRIYGPHIKYWDGISTLFEDLPETATVAEYQTSLNPITAKQFSYISHAAQLKTSEEAGYYHHVTEAYNEIDTKIKACERKMSENQDDINYYDREIKKLTEKIKTYESTVRNAKAIVSESQSKIDGYQPVIETLKQEKENASKIYDDYIANIDASEITGGVDFIANLKKSGIIINDIIYYSINGDNYISVKDNPEIALQVTPDKNSPYLLHEVSFNTVKPVVIRVDQGRLGPDKCPKIAGGPYKVTVNKNQLKIGLLNSAACYGINKSDSHSGYYYIHPHCQSRSYHIRKDNWADFTSLLSSTSNACLGEASPGLYKAFTSNDPKMAVFAAMTWVTSANSADAWGKHWKYFPSIDEVNIDGEPKSFAANEDATVEDLLNTEEGMEQLSEIAEQLVDVLGEEQVSPTPPPPRETISILMPEDILLLSLSSESRVISNPTNNNTYRRYTPFTEIAAATQELNATIPLHDREELNYLLNSERNDNLAPTLQETENYIDTNELDLQVRNLLLNQLGDEWTTPAE